MTSVVFQDNHTSSEGGSGGAIVSYGPVTAVDSRFEGNSAANGGAVYLRFGAAVGNFTNITFMDNSALSAVNGWGGAVLLWDGARLTVRGCDFESNSARFGGAIHNQFANVETIIEQGTIFRSNTASAQGGALWLQAGSTQVDKSLLLENAANFGAGIYQGGGTLTVADSTIASNVAQQGGGGLKIRGGVATLRGTTLAGNTTSGAGLGAGISVRSFNDTQLSLLNSTLSGNSGWYGAAIFALTESGDATIDLRFVTISANVSTENRAVIEVIFDVQLNLVSTVLSGNHARECQFLPGTENFRTARFSLWSDTSCTFGTSEQNHPNTDAALGPLADNGGWTLTHAPLPGSPLIDNGSCLAGVTTDQRGASRLHGLACDIGAVEAGAVVDGSLFADGFEAAMGWFRPTGAGLASSPARSP